MRVIVAFLVNTLCNFAIGLLVAKFLGPEEFGRFALALAVAMVMQTAQFEWIRLSSIRFYSERSRAEEPSLRATLDLCFAMIAALVSLVAAAIMFLGLDAPISNALIGLAVAVSITNGLFDFNTAMVRARFDDRLYGRLVLTKNLVALVATAGGALVFRSATMAILGVCLSMAGSILVYRARLSDRAATPNLASRAIAWNCARYAAPIVVANLLYLAVPLVNRALVARWYGYAETGQFSLAYDIGTRVVAAIGSALDVLLFQMAVRADEQHGAAEGREQVARNMAVVFAIMAPTCAGIWLTLPSIQQLVVPVEFRGPFEHYFSVLLPGHMAFGLLCFAVNPVFQIAKRTAPMILGAIVACGADVALVTLLPASSSSLAMAQSGAMLAGLFTLIAYAAATGARFPSARDLAAASAGTIVMLLALAPLRALTPGVATLAAQVIGGVAIYAAFVVAFNIADLRAVGRGVARATIRRVVPRARVAAPSE